MIGYKNLGQGNFDENADFVLTQSSGTAATTALAVADLNKDGISDIVAGNRGSWSSFESTIHPLTVFFGLEQGGFSDGLALDLDMHYQTLGLALADINNDGYLDIIAARGGETPPNSSGQQNKVYLFNEASGDYDDNSAILFGTGNDASRGVAIADMNDDGRLDILVSNECEASYIYLQDEKG